MLTGIDLWIEKTKYKKGFKMGVGLSEIIQYFILPAFTYIAWKLSGISKEQHQLSIRLTKVETILEKNGRNT